VVPLYLTDFNSVRLSVLLLTVKHRPNLLFVISAGYSQGSFGEKRRGYSFSRW